MIKIIDQMMMILKRNKTFKFEILRLLAMKLICEYFLPFQIQLRNNLKI